MPYKDKLTKLSYNREYRLKNKEKLKEYFRNLYLKNKGNEEKVKNNWERRIEAIKKSRKDWQKWKKKLYCVDCGFSGKNYPTVLEFDHRNPGEKKLAISSFVCKGTKLNNKKLQEEIKKCDIVCANCHRIRTYKRR